MKAKVEISCFMKEHWISVYPEENPEISYDALAAIGEDLRDMLAATTENLRRVIAVLRLAGVEVELTSHAQRLLEEKP